MKTDQVTLRCPDCAREVRTPALLHEVPESVLVMQCPECLPGGAFQEGPDYVILPTEQTNDHD